MTAHARPLPAPVATSGPANPVAASGPANPVAASGPASTAAPAGLRAAGSLRLLTWPALDAAGVDAAVTAREGGVSTGPYATLNLSLTVGDDPSRVLENRRLLAAALGVSPGDFVFARQVHGAGVRIVGEADRGSGAFTVDDAISATDALVTTSPSVVLAILTADCVPIVLHDPVAGVLACVHAGWRGTVARVAAKAVTTMTSLGSRPSDIIAGLGPAANPARYQVGPDVHQAITQAFQAAPAETASAQAAAETGSVAGTASAQASAERASAQAASAPTFLRPDPAAPDRWLLDLWAANRHVLLESGLLAPQIYTTTLPTGPLSHPTSTVSPGAPTIPGHFFSDRAARPCGRLALVARLRPPGSTPMSAEP